MTVSTPSFRDDLTAEQVKLVEALKADVSSIVENNAALKVFCSDHTYVRFLRARQWNLQKAAKMLHTTLEWRMENKPHLIRFEDIKPECVTGKTYVYPDSDKQGRPIVLMRPRLENTKTYDRQVKYLIYVLEQASRVADQRGIGKMTWLLDFEEYSMSNAPPLQVSLNCNHILQHHYPERLAAAVCYHAPWLFSMTWKAVRPFVDSVTQKKILFADKGAAEKQVMDDNFHLEKLEKCLGGAIDGFVFDLEKFEQECKAYDAEVASELAAMEARLQEPSVVALPAPASNQVTEQVVEA